MEDNGEISFPQAFGNTIEEFLEHHGGLLYSIIAKRCYEGRRIITSDGKHLELKAEPENIFQGFVGHILKDDYKVLRRYKGLNGAQPRTYLVKVLQFFISNELQREKRRRVREINDEEVISVARSVTDPSEILIIKDQLSLIAKSMDDM